MRQNLPVFNQEYLFPEGETLVSATDLKGRITYCNPAFVRVSGFAREELLGQPHNIIRHPDMPSEAFRDLWATIQSGEPWSALVKNRRKDGSYYWVMANVTPIIEHGRVNGYMSVRTRPSREEVQEAEELYARMRAEQAEDRVRTVLRQGHVVQHSLLGRVRSVLAVSLSAWVKFTPVLVGLVSAAAGLAAGGALGSPAGYAVLAGAAAIGAAAGWGLRARVVQPLRTMLEAANRMAAGDLSQRLDINRRDEVGRLQQALSQLNVNLQAVVGDVRQEVEGIHLASAEIAAGNLDLSGRTETQAGQLQQTATSLEQITGNVHQSAEAARQAAQAAAETTSMAERGQQAVREAVAHMDEIARASGRISEIIGVIDGISFQTNLLALNAAVEAARAGEQGKGFAVVAGEVRALAQRTQVAAGEIKKLIDDTAAKVAQGSTLVQQNGELMQATLAAVQRVNDLIRNISEASQEQSRGLTDINQSVGTLDDLTQQNAAMVEQLSAAAASLRNQAEVVADAVRIFRLTVSPAAT